MQIARKLTSQAFIETLFASKAPVEEGFLYAKFEFECRARGADVLAYPPVVAGGNGSNTLHHVKNNQRIEDGEMVLLDGGCESSCCVSDITRTWPVNGRFTAPQAERYEAVLEVQRDCLTLCSPGTSLDNVYSMMLTLIGQKLKELGIMKNIMENSAFKAARKYCPHRVGHYLGMDVHDTPDVPRSLPLQPGMVITVEPGIYIPEDDKDAPEKFHGLGVRIEDDVMVTEDSPLIVSADCPKEMNDIEQICSRASTFMATHVHTRYPEWGQLSISGVWLGSKDEALASPAEWGSPPPSPSLAFTICRVRATLLDSMASRCVGFSSCDTLAQYLWLTGLVAPWHVGSSQTRARTHVPCIGRQTLNHHATREVPYQEFILDEDVR
ncbi:hypothetical protein J1605_002797 [Eschrichtius robustus]|uniref:Peptidase M24 domain-containing protein n=1 Tax=Eschrichtius robustus TaxID=9764 RepID=A0AB34HYG8_ESCRO|nr:hypothetical protein J1605_002797 [Eschrichtius robustus]